MSRSTPSTAPAQQPRVPLGVWEAADERAESWETACRKLYDVAYRLTHCKGSGEYVRAFDDLREVVAELGDDFDEGGPR